ncbi:hypothetical protein ACE38W_04375 [Chitinophaga sp. Hz27]|uniref:hypothetical protein n=1 Tax=Chitinophaga sp. Hz27 TaxID=3347169 RepID=UPI0035E302AC
MLKKSLAVIAFTLMLGSATYAQKQVFPGSVGIAIDSSLMMAKLHIGGNVVDSNTSTFRMGRSNDQGNRDAPMYGVSGAYNIDFAGYRDVIPNQIGARIRAERINLWGQYSLVQGMDLAFSTSTGATSESLKERLRITNAGNVGIGTNQPNALLSINSPQINIQEITKPGIPSSIGGLIFGNATTTDTNFIPMIRGRAKAEGRPFGLYVIGHAADVVPTGDDAFSAAILLDARGKGDVSLLNNNLLTVSNYGNPMLMVKSNGSVCVGTTDAKGYKFAVNGNAIFTKVVVKENSKWPDYVFTPDYQLPSLGYLEDFIREHQHLPGFPAAAAIEQNGQDIAAVNRQLVQKVEELTLYIIELNKRLSQQEEKINALNKTVSGK